MGDFLLSAWQTVLCPSYLLRPYCLPASVPASMVTARKEAGLVPALKEHCPIYLSPSPSYTITPVFRDSEASMWRSECGLHAGDFLL